MLAPDPISNSVELVMWCLGLAVGVWLFLDAEGVFRFLCWWDPNRKFPKRRLLIMKWTGALCALGVAWILLAHLLKGL